MPGQVNFQTLTGLTYRNDLLGFSATLPERVWTGPTIGDLSATIYGQPGTFAAWVEAKGTAIFVATGSQYGTVADITAVYAKDKIPTTTRQINGRTFYEVRFEQIDQELNNALMTHTVTWWADPAGGIRIVILALPSATFAATGAAEVTALQNSLKFGAEMGPAPQNPTASAAPSGSPGPAASPPTPALEVHQVQWLSLPPWSSMRGNDTQKMLIVTLTYPSYEVGTDAERQARAAFQAIVDSMSGR